MTDQLYDFSLRKDVLFVKLNAGIVVKREWDEIIAEAKSLCADHSMAQLQRYYNHYRIGDMGIVDLEQPEKVFAEPVMMEAIHESKATKTGFPAKFSRQYQLILWRDALIKLRKSISREDFDAYVGHLTLKKLSRDYVEIVAPDSYTAEKVNELVLTELVKILCKILDNEKVAVMVLQPDCVE